MGVNLSELGPGELTSDSTAFLRLMFHYSLGLLLCKAWMFLLDATVQLSTELGQELIPPVARAQGSCQAGAL